MAHGVDLVFNAVSWHACDAVQDDEDGDGDGEYVIKVFGVRRGGGQVALTIRGFVPHFYFKVPREWTGVQLARARDAVAALGGVRSFDVVKKVDFWGFSNGLKERFVRLCFGTHAAMRRVAGALGRGLLVQGRRASLRLYESNIEPHVRFVHMRGLQPSGWLRVPAAALRRNPGLLPARCAEDYACAWTAVEHEAREGEIAPFKVASFDIECMSHTGDFPVARVTDHRRLARTVVDTVARARGRARETAIEAVGDAVAEAVASARTARPMARRDAVEAAHAVAEELYALAAPPPGKLPPAALAERREAAIAAISAALGRRFPLPLGDEIIQIAVTTHRYGEHECFRRFVAVLGTCATPLPSFPDAVVVQCETERDVLMAFAREVADADPDLVTGYNIFGFDWAYIVDRADVLGVRGELMDALSRLDGVPSEFIVQKLSSSALGDNELRLVSMPGRTQTDLMKVVQRDHKLDSYKLDSVAKHFTGEAKDDVSPADIFRLQRGGASDRAVVANYCVQDAALVNHLVVKLEVVANNVGMSNVCLVPLDWIFRRGQGVKIFSLVTKQCKDDGYVVPVVRPPKDADLEDGGDDGYEGAIVLDPQVGLYVDDPVSVLDYSSLYPSSMIAENLSHDKIVLDDDAFGNVPGVPYNEVRYDLLDADRGKVGERVVRYAVDGPGVLPRILTKLVQQRKATRRRMELRELRRAGAVVAVGYLSADGAVLRAADGGAEHSVGPGDSVAPAHSAFALGILEGLQLAYKVVANSLYGQMGARTSPLYLKDIAACTTATGRRMITAAKAFMEAEYGARVVYGDTDSIFCIFDNRDPATGDRLIGKAALRASIETAKAASRAFRAHIKPPHELAYEKTFMPFILLARKKYCGQKYEDDVDRSKQAAMGLVLRRRDNARIVKHVYNGILETILQRGDVAASIDFLRGALDRLVAGGFPMEDLVISKALRADYKAPELIAHKVLADRMAERDPGNKPQLGDRIPYVYVQTPRGKAVLQGDKIEHPDYIRAHGIKVDYLFYIEHQIVRPVCQLYAVMHDRIPGFRRTRHDYDVLFKKLLKDCGGDAEKAEDRLTDRREKDVEAHLFGDVLLRLRNARDGNREITGFFKRTA